MKIKFLLMTMLLLLLWNAVAYAQYSSEKELMAKIRSYKNDDSLKKFLKKQDMIPPSFSGIFHVEDLKIDVFKRNLFGTSDYEITIQLRDGNYFSVNFFYYENRILKKVPENICYPYEPVKYANNFSFAYENIFSENEFAVIVRTFVEYGRSTTDFKEIYQITPGAIRPIYGYERYASYFSGMLTESRNWEASDTFLLIKNTYPKCLILNGKFYNYHGNGVELGAGGDGMDESPDGCTSEGTQTDSVFFTRDTILKVMSHIKEERVCYINSFDYLSHGKKEGCETNFNFITKKFAFTYLQEPEKPFTELDTIREGYVKGTCVYVQDRILYVTGFSPKTLQSIIYSYPLKPSLASLLRATIVPDSLYYNGNIMSYGDKSKVDYAGMIPVCFSNEDYVYELDLENKYIRIISTPRHTYDIPVKLLQPYLKPEILQQFNQYK